jgi:hypothetical protein
MVSVDSTRLFEIFFRSVQAHDSLDSIFASPDLGGFRAYYGAHVPKIIELVESMSLGQLSESSPLGFGNSRKLHEYVVLSIAADFARLIDISSGRLFLARERVADFRVRFYGMSQVALRAMSSSQRRRVASILRDKRIHAYLCDERNALGLEEFLRRMGARAKAR